MKTIFLAKIKEIDKQIISNQNKYIIQSSLNDLKEEITLAHLMEKKITKEEVNDWESEIKYLNSKLNNDNSKISKPVNYNKYENEFEDIHNKQISAIMRIIRKNKESKALVNNINDELNNQKNNLLLVQKEIYESQSLILRGKEFIKFFSKNLSNDNFHKIIWIINMFLVFMIIIIIIFKNKSENPKNLFDLINTKDYFFNLNNTENTLIIYLNSINK